jgi:pectinesterase
MTQGIREELSMIFTYVDEKKGRRLTCDVYRPASSKGPFPGIVIYFGGGWQNGRPGLHSLMT